MRFIFDLTMVDMRDSIPMTLLSYNGFSLSLSETARTPLVAKHSHNPGNNGDNADND